MLEQLTEGRPEHPIHAAIQDEVDGAIRQCQDVPQVAEALIAVQEETFPPNPHQQSEYPLRELSYKKQQKNGDQHARSSVSSSFNFAGFFLSTTFHDRTYYVIFSQYLFSFLRSNERLDQPAAN